MIDLLTSIWHVRGASVVFLSDAATLCLVICPIADVSDLKLAEKYNNKVRFTLAFNYFTKFIVFAINSITVQFTFT